ncbi:MAG TPA: hypothetical protein VFO29_10480 [Candidatus Rubrimentiphilum sp.]|nr:hypothetical protein [Candidatus Rubrimentiphilum sp.]
MPAYRRLPIFLLAAFASIAAACGGNTTTLLQPVTVLVTPVPAPAVTSQSAFTVQQTVDLNALTNLPVAGGYSGTLQLGGAIQQYAQVTQTLQNATPSGIAPLAITFKPADTGRSTLDVSPAQVLFYYGLLFDARMPAYVSPLPSPTDPPPSSITLTVQVPAAVFLSGVKYYLALYDPQRPGLGWQQGFAGPAAISGSTLTFTGSAQTFNRYEQYWLAVYAVNQSAAAPTPAPSTSPVVTPSPAPISIVAIQSLMSSAFVCSGTPCATGPITPPQPPSMWDITTGVKPPLPSISGNSTQLTLFPSTPPPHESDVLYQSPPLVSAPLTTNAIWDFYYYIDQPVWAVPSAHPTATPGPTTMTALEFDFNMGMPNYRYNFSSQCLILDNVNGGPKWQIWGGGSLGWIDSGFACDTNNFMPNVWHHLTWVYRIHPDTQQTEYVSLTIDGVTTTPPPNNAFHPVQQHVEDKTFLEVQFQQDMHQPGPTDTPPPFKEWVDNVTLTYW